MIQQELTETKKKVEELQSEFREFSKSIISNQEKLFENQLSKFHMKNLKNEMKALIGVGQTVLKDLEHRELIKIFRQMYLELTQPDAPYLRKVFQFLKFKYEEVHFKRDFTNADDRGSPDYRTPGEQLVELVALRGHYLELMQVRAFVDFFSRD